MDKKQEILNETYYLFSEKGYNLSMSEIAKAVKIKPPSLYSHFKSKDEIIELTIKSEIENRFDTVCKRIPELEGKTCEEKLKSILFVYINYYKEFGKLRFWRHIPLLQNDKLRNISRVLLEDQNSYLRQRIRTCFENGIKNGEIEESVSEGAIYLYFSMIQGILDCMIFNKDDGIEIENFSSMTWEAYWKGIKFRKSTDL